MEEMGMRKKGGGRCEIAGLTGGDESAVAEPHRVEPVDDLEGIVRSLMMASCLARPNDGLLPSAA